MIVTANRVYGSRLATSDGNHAGVRDLLFDDRAWHIRHLVVRLRHFLSWEDVLLTSEQIESADWSSGTLQTPLLLAEVTKAPTLLSNPPVAKQEELKAARMIAWEAYWTGLFNRLPDFGDPHIRNTRAVTGHRVFGVDSEVGFIDNFVIDDQGWKIRYVVVRLGRRRSGRRVMVDPHLVDAISWQDHSVWIHLPRESIERCDEFVAELT